MYQKNITKKMIPKYSNCKKNKIIEGYEDIASFTTEKKISQTEILVRISYPDFFSLMIKDIVNNLKRGAYE